MATKKTTRKMTKPSASASKKRTPVKSKGTKTMAKKTSAAPARKTAKKAAGKSTRKTAKKTTAQSAPKAAVKAAKKQSARKAQAAPSGKAAAKRKPATPKEASAPVARAKKKAATGAPVKKLTERDLARLREELLQLRQHLTGQIDSLKTASLTRDDAVVSPEDGTDAFDRQFNLNLVRTEGEALFDIEEALRRIDDGTYGVCETCECTIPKARLEALPFVKNCVACQAEMEKGKVRFRPLPKGRARP